MNCWDLLIGTWVTPKQFHCGKSTIFQNFLWNWNKVMCSEGGRQVGGRTCLVRVQWHPHPLLLCGHSKPDLRMYWGGVIMLWPKDRGSHAMFRGPCSILWVLCSSDGASLTSVRKISAAPNQCGMREVLLLPMPGLTRSCWARSWGKYETGNLLLLQDRAWSCACRSVMAVPAQWSGLQN